MVGKVLCKPIAVLLTVVLLLTLIPAGVFAQTGTDNTFAAYITRSGDKLMEGDQEFRAIAVNAPTLLAIEDDYFHMPSDWEIEQAFKTFVQTGASAVRTYALSVKKASDTNGQVKHLIGPDGELNENAFIVMDKVLAAANKYGVRLVIPFIDQYSAYPGGGIADFTAFRGKTEDAFWTDAQVIADFKAVMTNVLNRVNTVTGVKYMDDKAVLAWETGNEIRPVSHVWTRDIALHLKSIDANHLVLDGKYGIDDASLTDDAIDIVSNHYYPSAGDYVQACVTDRNKAKGKKPFVIGEFGFKKPAELDELFSAVIENGTSAAFIWSLRYLNENGGFYPHSEGQFGDTFYAAYRWPGFTNGSSYYEKETLQLLQKRAFEIRGLAVPAVVIPEASVLLNSDSVSVIKWRGSAGATSHEVQRKEGVDGAWMTIAANYEDSLTDPGVFDDIAAADGKQYYYRVAAQNAAGKSDYSNIIGPIAANHAIVDEIRSGGQYFMEWAKIYDRSNELTFDRDYTARFHGDISRIVQRSTAAEQYVTYATPTDVSSFRFETYMDSAGTGAEFKVVVSTDDVQYTDAQPITVITAEAGGTMSKKVYSSNTLPAGVRFVKIVFPQNALSAELGKAVVGYVNPEGLPLKLPGKKGKQLMTNGILKDEMNDDLKMFEHSGNLGYEKSNPEYFGGDESRLSRNQNTAEHVLYKSEGNMNYIRMMAYARQEAGKYKVPDFTISVSSDGAVFEDVAAVVDRKAGDGWWEKQNYTIYTLPEGTKCLKVTFPVLPAEGADQVWNPQLGSVEIGIGDAKLEPPAEASRTSMVDDFEGYSGLDSKLRTACKVNTWGDPVNISLDSNNKYSGMYGLQFNPVIGTNGWGGYDKDIGKQDWTGTSGISFWVNPNGYTVPMTLQFTEGADTINEPWKYDLTVSGSGWQLIEVPFSKFYVPDWWKSSHPDGNGKVDPGAVSSYGIYANANAVVYFDEIGLFTSPVIDSFDEYKDNTALQAAYKTNESGDVIALFLETKEKNDGSQGLRLDYTLTDEKGYAGISKDFAPLDWSGRTGIQTWIKPTGTKHGICLQFREESGEYWEVKTVITGTKAELISIPFHSFTKPGWNASAGDGVMDLKAVNQFSIYVDKGEGKIGEASLYLDSICLVPMTAIESFEYYQGSDALLQAAYTPNEWGDSVAVTLDKNHVTDGNLAMKYSYKLDKNGWGGVKKNYQATSFAGGSALQFWCRPDGQERGLSVQFVDKDGDIWKASLILNGSKNMLISIPFTEFTRTQWSQGKGTLDLGDIKELGMYVDKGKGENGSGAIWFDDIQVAAAPVLDDFDYYSDYGIDLIEKGSYVKNQFGNKLIMKTENTNKDSGSCGAEFTYTIDNTANFTGATKFLGTASDWTAYDGIQLWLKPDGSDNRFVLQFKEKDGEPWDVSYKLTGTEPVLLQIPWHSFKRPAWYSGTGNGILDLNNVTEYSFYVNMGDRGPTTSTLYIDSVKAAEFDLVEGFEQYYFDETLRSSYWVNEWGDAIMLALDGQNKNEGNAGLKYSYDLSKNGWGGIELTIPQDNWTEYKGLELWVKPTGTEHGLVIQIAENSGEAWKYNIGPVKGTKAQMIRIPFEKFLVAGDWALKDGKLDLTSITKLCLYVDNGIGTKGPGVFYFDSIRLYGGTQ
jgi:hypothetical protein